MLETVSAGVPLLAWPLHAVQRVNAVMLAERAGPALALQPRGKNDDRVVTREEVAAMVTVLILGEKGAATREKARKLQDRRPRRRPGHRTDRHTCKAFEAVAGEWKKAATLRSCGAS
ncbi:unnamed protein product [Urochloa humidicola]